MTESRFYTLQQLLDRLGMNYDEVRKKMDCFGCGKKKKINLDFDSNTYRCPACGESGGVLHLFAISCMDIPRDAFPDKGDRKKLGEIKEALQQFMEGTGSGSTGTAPAPRKATHEETPKIPVLSDDALNAVYEALQKVPALQLTEKHRKELRRRGLDDDAIDRNGYRSIPEDLPASQHYTEMYERDGGEHRRQKMSWLSARQIIFGLSVADSIVSQGFDLQGVPGFFKFGIHWCFWSNPGILIPTRNIKGQIVIWQVRRDKLLRKDDAKYITVASRKLPSHVTEGVSRCHFPLANAPLSAEHQLLITEGPLKADIACHLYGGPVILAAIPGIQTTKDLLSYSRTFKKAKIYMVYNALDMDRITNPNVRKGADRLRKDLKNKGLMMRDMFWDEQFATSRLLSCMTIARLRKIPVVTSPSTTGKLSVFERLDAASKALDTAGINAFRYTDANGQTVPLYWDPATKGIDDFLYNRINP